MTTNAIVLLAHVTAYVATGHTCANCKMPRVSYTIAAPRNIPLGTRVYVSGGIGYRTVEDRTNIRYNGRWDLFVRSKKEALTWGNRELKITIIKP